MIEDEELRTLFRAESEEHLQTLDDGLLRMESERENADLIEQMFRAAHSLKGAARMVGEGAVEQIAHRFEDALSAARHDHTHLSAQKTDLLYGQLDAIRALVREATTGERADVDVEAVLMQIDDHGEGGAELADDATEADLSPAFAAEIEEEWLDEDEHAVPEESATLAPETQIVARRERAQQRAEVEPSPAAPTPPNAAFAADYRIDTVRVDADKLDELMRQVAELSVVKIRMDNLYSQLDSMLYKWEEWQRRIAKDARDARDARGNDVHQRRFEELGQHLEQVRNAAYEDQTRLELVLGDLEEGIRRVRLLPVSTTFRLFARVVRDLAQQQGKDVELVIEGGDTTVDKRIVEELKDPLMHMVRNAVDHGIENPQERRQNGKDERGTLWLRCYRQSAHIYIEVADDGRGLDAEKIRTIASERNLHSAEELQQMDEQQLFALIMTPGFSTSAIITDVSGRGVGMDVVRANIENLKGQIHIESKLGQGCLVRLELPMSIATTRVLLAVASGQTYALPVEYVESTQTIDAARIFTLEGRRTIVLNDEKDPLPLAHLGDLLERDHSAQVPNAPCVVLSVGGNRSGLLVDQLIDEREIVIKPLRPPLRRVRNVAGTTLLGSGEVCIVLSASDLAAAVRGSAARVSTTAAEPEHVQQVILLVEDSITTRTQEKRILEAAGYEVVTAVDGADGLGKLGTRDFAAVVSDVEMPNIDGLKMTATIREDERYGDLPIILVTSLASEKDRQRGMEAGANAYISKPGFDQRILIETVKRLA